MSTDNEPAAATEPPKNVHKLHAAVAAAARNREATVKRIQSLVGNVILAQMLPDSAVKGGTGLKLRFGDSVTRETPDLDTAFRGDRTAFIDELNTKLKVGWGDFTGTVTAGEQRAPDELLERITFAYVMQPARVKLSYKGKSFMSLDLEIGYDELEATTSEPAELAVATTVEGDPAAVGGDIAVDQHHLVGVGVADELDADVVPVGPEGGQGAVRLRLRGVEGVAGGGGALVGGGGPVLHPLAQAEGGVGPGDDVAGGVHTRDAGPEGLVAPDPAEVGVEVEAGAVEPVDGGHDADADDDEVGGQLGAPEIDQARGRRLSSMTSA